MDELDIDLDTADRISQRIAHGVYRITHGKRVVGEELWGIFGLRSGGFRLMSEIDLKSPMPNKQRAQLDLDEHWQARKLWVEVDVDGRRRMATYTPDRPANLLFIQVSELLLRYVDSGKGGRSLDGPFMLNPPDKSKVVYEDEVPFDSQSYLDFASTLFNFAHFKRISNQLREKNKARIKAVVVKLPSLEPLLLKQTYEYITDEPVNPFVVRDCAALTTRQRRFGTVDRRQHLHSPALALFPKKHGFLHRIFLALQSTGFNRAADERFLVGREVHFHILSLGR